MFSAFRLIQKLFFRCLLRRLSRPCPKIIQKRVLRGLLTGLSRPAPKSVKFNFLVQLLLDLDSRVIVQIVSFKVRLASRWSELFRFPYHCAPQCICARLRCLVCTRFKSKKLIFTTFGALHSTLQSTSVD